MSSLEIRCGSPYFEREVKKGDTLTISEVRPPLTAYCHIDGSFGNVRHNSGKVQVDLKNPEATLTISGRRPEDDLLRDRPIDIHVRLTNV